MNYDIDQLISHLKGSPEQVTCRFDDGGCFGCSDSYPHFDITIDREEYWIGVCDFGELVSKLVTVIWKRDDSEKTELVKGGLRCLKRS